MAPNGALLRRSRYVWSTLALGGAAAMYSLHSHLGDKGSGTAWVKANVYKDREGGAPWLARIGISVVLLGQWHVIDYVRSCIDDVQHCTPKSLPAALDNLSHALEPIFAGHPLAWLNAVGFGAADTIVRATAHSGVLEVTRSLIGPDARPDAPREARAAAAGLHATLLRSPAVRRAASPALLQDLLDELEALLRAMQYPESLGESGARLQDVDALAEGICCCVKDLCQADATFVGLSLRKPAPYTPAREFFLGPGMDQVQRLLRELRIALAVQRSAAADFADDAELFDSARACERALRDTLDRFLNALSAADHPLAVHRASAAVSGAAVFSRSSATQVWAINRYSPEHQAGAYAHPPRHEAEAAGRRADASMYALHRALARAARNRSADSHPVPQWWTDEVWPPLARGIKAASETLLGSPEAVFSVTGRHAFAPIVGSLVVLGAVGVGSRIVARRVAAVLRVPVNERAISMSLTLSGLVFVFGTSLSTHARTMTDMWTMAITDGPILTMGPLAFANYYRLHIFALSAPAAVAAGGILCMSAPQTYTLLKDDVYFSTVFALRRPVERIDGATE